MKKKWSEYTKLLLTRIGKAKIKPLKRKQFQKDYSKANFLSQVTLVMNEGCEKKIILLHDSNEKKTSWKFWLVTFNMILCRKIYSWKDKS